MKHPSTTNRLLPALGLALGLASVARGHDLGSCAEHPHYNWTVKPPEIILAQAAPQNRAPVGDRMVRTNRPAQAVPFEAFAPKVNVRWDEKFLYVESNGLPSHNMMVGITAWQQQVPLPQNYTGDNAWRIPLAPVPAKEVISIKNRFLRGAIALAVNGIPIFNPQNNRGEVSQEIGELDEWGGHCGRTDDYHYHAAPLHLQAVAGKGQPIAFALDGYPIYGLTEPDGSQPAGLDAFNGHTTQALVYHYHASKKYPYVNGGFHGEVVERNGQVDPQPRTGGVREYTRPLPGAKITGFTSEDGKKFSVKYEVGSETRYVNYVLNDDASVKFDFVDGQGQVKTETHSPRERRGGGGGGGNRPSGDGRGKGGRGKDQDKDGPRPDGKLEDGRPPGAQAAAPMLITPKHSGSFVLTSPAIKDGDPLPDEYNGNGEGATLPLEWKGAPAGTQSYALVMDHIDRENVLKTYWTMYDIPPDVTSLPKNVKGIGKLGATWKRDQTYVTPHSAGGAKQTYTLHLYALSAAPKLNATTDPVTREELLTAIKDTILDSAELHLTYTRPRDASAGGNRKPGDKAGQKKDERK